VVGRAGRVVMKEYVIEIERSAKRETNYVCIPDRDKLSKKRKLSLANFALNSVCLSAE